MGNDEILLKEEKGLKYIQFKKLLEFNVKHFYSLKSDGIDFATGGALEENSYKLVSDILGINRERLIIPKQSHGDCVKCVNENTSLDDMKFTDGIITDCKGLALSTKNADCILLYFYDPVKKVIANVHSGWRGTYQKIAEKSVIKMISNYGCKPEDIYCFINPCIRVDHFEVDSDVMELGKIIFGFTHKTDEFIKKGRIVDGKQKYNVDTVLINKILLENLGIKSKNIIDCEICSVCNSDKIASVRGNGNSELREVSVIML